jgi:hypothetical protein
MNKRSNKQSTDADFDDDGEPEEAPIVLLTTVPLVETELTSADDIVFECGL